MTNHLKMHSLNKIDENIAKIARLFPNCVTEAKDENGEITKKIDFDMLKQELSHSLVEGREERYQFTWPDKKQAILTANAPINKTLRPCREESVNFDETENLYIEGDNLEVLKLLQETYLGKIKMIYIDPPYNTGNDFVYNDDFRTKNLEFREKSGNFDEEGKQLVDNYTRNTESNGRFHTDWLNMMYPRLKLAKDLLSDDGVIFISIDDNEQSNLEKICNEIFGNENFQGMFIINASPSAIDYGNMAKMHEYALMYSKNALEVSTNQLQEKDKVFKFTDDRGGFIIYPLYNGNVAFNPQTRPNLYYPFYLNPNKNLDNGFFEIGLEKRDNWIEVFPVVSKKEGIPRVWRWGKDKAKENLNKEIVGYKNEEGEYRIVQKYRGDKKTIRSLLLENNVSSRRGTAEVQNLFENKIFSFPKPVDLVKLFSTVGANNDSLILDFFSGSATTAHAVMQLNAEEIQNLELSIENLEFSLRNLSKSEADYESKFKDLNSKLQELNSQLSHQRKFIMVQLPEPCDEKSEAFKAGYKNICEIGKERIRRAGKQILELSLENLEKEGVIEKYAGKLSEIRSLEEIYGFSGESLSVGEKTSERGNVCSVGSDEKSSGVDSIEYSGRTSERNQRVHSISENSKGVSCRIGDTTIDLRTLELLNNLGYRIKFESFGGDKQNDLFSDNNSNSETLSTQLSTLKSKLSVLTTLDIGFRVLKCDTSNMEDVYYTPDHIDTNDLFKNNIKSDRTPEDLLFQVMLDLGIMLSSKIQTKQIDGKTVYCVEGNYLVACFDEDVTEETITKIAKEKPYYFVMRDASMANDSVATNFEQIFKTYLGESYNPDNIRII